MTAADPTEVTLYLQRMEAGDAEAVERLLPLIYGDLRDLASRLFQDQWRHHTLQPTALVHEAYLRLCKPQGGGAFESRRHFLSVASIAMRQLLTDYARSRNAQKREGGHQRIPMEDVDEPSGDEAGVDLVALDEALTELQGMNERQARIVELRFLTGLTVEETAEILGVTERTVYLDWKMARTWLEQRLS